MFYEYALDPAVLTSWQSVRYFLDAFGPWKGRFLAEYPRRWRERVYRGLVCGDVEKKRIEVRLGQLEARVFSPRRGAIYDDARSWLDNAEVEHARQAFHAIIATETRGRPFIVDGVDLDENEPRWRVEQGSLLSRDPLLFAGALRLLLLASTQVVLIDPYFRADQADKARPVTAFCNVLRATAAQIQIHTSEDGLTCAQQMRHAARALPGVVPDGMSITLRCWKEKAGGARLHNRYLLTDIGGVQFGDSIEVGDQGHLDRVSILEEPSRAALWDQYLGATPAFDAAGPAQQFQGRRGR